MRQYSKDDVKKAVECWNNLSGGFSYEKELQILLDTCQSVVDGELREDTFCGVPMSHYGVENKLLEYGYIRKDSLPGVDELASILKREHCFLSGDEFIVAKAIHKAIHG